MTQETTVLTTGLTHRVAAEIRAELARQQMTQRELARRIGIDQAIVSKRLTGGPARSWTLDELDSIAVALGVPAAWFFTAPSTASAA
jgi:transcriptional regulator with XRE-family HTH domain